MRRECRERFSRHRLQRNPLINDPGIHHGTWCMSGSLTRSGGENVPGIPGAYATRNFTYLARDPLRWRHMSGMASLAPGLFAQHCAYNEENIKVPRDCPSVRGPDRLHLMPFHLHVLTSSCYPETRFGMTFCNEVTLPQGMQAWEQAHALNHLRCSSEFGYKWTFNEWTEDIFYQNTRNDQVIPKNADHV